MMLKSTASISPPAPNCDDIEIMAEPPDYHDFDAQRIKQMEEMVQVLQEQVRCQQEQLLDMQQKMGMNHDIVPVVEDSKFTPAAAEQPEDVPKGGVPFRLASSAKAKVLHLMDRYHNTETKERRPSGAGFICTTVLFIFLLTYTVLWIVRYEQSPPSELTHIKWSAFGGFQEMEVECVGAPCWLWFASCGSLEHGHETGTDTCLEMQPGERRTIGMCYRTDPRDGLTAKWLVPADAHGDVGVRVWSDMESGDEEGGVMPMGQMLLDGFQLATLVKTHNKTVDKDNVARRRIEWFITFSSAVIPEALHTPSRCTELNTQHPEAGSARVLMMPQFFEKEIEKPSMYLPLFGALGGAFELVDQLVFLLYGPAYLIASKWGLVL
mmetsp:Transcript_43831/g.80045  ORF Transcript_43831/g.80045 Transcript_43831/m.80045 type:complete len:380 (-) Transcript_43831:58-1197(-)